MANYNSREGIKVDVNQIIGHKNQSFTSPKKKSLSRKRMVKTRNNSYEVKILLILP